MSQQIADETVEMMGFIQNRTAEILWSRFADSAVRQGASIDALRPYHYPFAQDCFDRLVNQPALQRVIENAKSRAKVVGDHEKVRDFERAPGWGQGSVDGESWRQSVAKAAIFLSR